MTHALRRPGSNCWLAPYHETSLGSVGTESLALCDAPAAPRMPAAVESASHMDVTEAGQILHMRHAIHYAGRWSGAKRSIECMQHHYAILNRPRMNTMKIITITAAGMSRDTRIKGADEQRTS